MTITITYQGLILTILAVLGMILLVYLMRRMGFTKTECKQLIAGYEAIIEHFRAELPINVYSRIIKTTARGKLTALRQFVSNG